MPITIRNEKKEDYRTVEEITREAFWNLYVPGCGEHYLVNHIRGIPASYLNWPLSPSRITR